MLLFITLWVAFTGLIGQNEWLLHQYSPPGPVAYVDRPASGPYIGIAVSMFVILQLMTDGLMVKTGSMNVETGQFTASFQIYRCRLMWEGLCAIIIPSILWLATLGEFQLSTLRVSRPTSFQISLRHPVRLGLQHNRRPYFRWECY